MFLSTGVSADVKAIAGGGVNLNYFTDGNPTGWKGVSIGVSVGVGASINLLNGNVNISNSKLLNNVIPTSQRSFLDRPSNFTAPIPTALGTAIISGN